MGYTREIYGLENHEILEKELKLSDKRIKEGELEEACVHMRRAVEYMIKEFVKENPECTGKDLFEKIGNLQNEGIINQADAGILHKIRMAGNKVGAHISSEEINQADAKEMLDDLYEYIPKFLEKMPYPSKNTLVDSNRLSIAYDYIAPLRVGITKELIDIINKYSDWGDYPFQPIPEEFFYQKRDGSLYINLSEYAKFYEKKISKVLNAKRQLGDRESDVIIPGILQQIFEFSRVYQDGITPVFEPINEDQIVSELALYAREIHMPPCITKICNPKVLWSIDALFDYFEDAHPYWWEEEKYGDVSRDFVERVLIENNLLPYEKELHGNVHQLWLSNNLSIDSNFRWIMFLKPRYIMTHAGEERTLTVKDGSIYSADMKKLVFARYFDRAPKFVIPEGVEIIGSCAFYSSIESIDFPSSLKKLESGALASYTSENFILPDSVVDIAHDAFRESAQVYYNSEPSININAQYETYLKEAAETKRRFKEWEAKRQQEEIRKQKELAEQKALEEKLLQEKAQKEKREKRKASMLRATFVFAFIAIIAMLFIRGAKAKREELAAIEAAKNYANVICVDDVSLDQGDINISGTVEKVELTLGHRYTTEEKKFVFEFNEEGYFSDFGLRLIKYIGNETEVEVPKEIQGYPVIAIDGWVFAGNNNVEKVVIEAAITEGGLRDCPALKEVILPATVKSLGYLSYHNTPLLESITVDNSCVVHGSFAGDNMNPTVNYVAMQEGVGNDSKIVMESGNTYATEKGDFQFLFENNAITIIKYVGEETEAVVPKEIQGYPITSIYDTAFSNDFIEKVVIEAEVEGCKFKDAVSLTEVVFPSTVKYLTHNTFLNTPNLKTITISSDCTVDSTAIGNEVQPEIKYLN